MAATYSKVKTVITGEIITASDRNSEHDNHITNGDFGGLGDYSANNTEMQTTTDPFPSSAESLATDGKGELERIRYQILQIGKLLSRSTGFTQWYHDFPDPTAATTILDIDNTATNGDPGIGFSLSGTRIFTIGVDDSDSDILKIGTTAIETSTNLELDGSHVFFPDGAATAPSISFITDGDTGIYKHSTNKIGFAAGGTLQWSLSDSLISENSGSIRVGDGSVSAPSYTFTSDTNSGIFSISGDIFGFSTNGIERLRISGAIESTIEFHAPNGGATAGNVSYSFTNDTDTGLYRAAANELGIALGGAERFRVNTANTTDDIRISVYDHTAAAMVQVSRGATDSGGSGFRSLNVPN